MSEKFIFSGKYWESFNATILLEFDRCQICNYVEQFLPTRSNYKRRHLEKYLENVIQNAYAIGYDNGCQCGAEDVLDYEGELAKEDVTQAHNPPVGEWMDKKQRGEE